MRPSGPIFKIRFILLRSKVDAENLEHMPQEIMNISDVFKVRDSPDLQWVRAKIHVEKIGDKLVATGSLHESDLGMFTRVVFRAIEKETDERGIGIIRKAVLENVFLTRQPDNIFDKNIRQQLVEGEAVVIDDVTEIPISLEISKEKFEISEVPYHLMKDPPKINGAFDPRALLYIKELSEAPKGLVLFYLEDSNVDFRYGLRDRQSKELLPAVYHHIQFQDNLVVAFSLVPEQSVFVRQNEDLRFIGNFEDGLSPTFNYKPVKKNKRWGYISSLDGTLLIDYKYEWVYKFFSDKFSFVKQNELVGLIDGSGKEIFSCKFDAVLCLIDNQVIARFRGYWGSLTIEEMRIAIPFIYDDVGGTLNQHMLMVKREGKIGFVNTRNGKEVIQCIYDDADPFDISNPIARVQKDGVWNYLDINGRSINPFS